MELEQQLKLLIIESLSLEDITPEGWIGFGFC